MVASKEDDVFGVFDFIAEKELDCLDGVVTSIDEITNEDVPVCGELPSYFEKLKNVKELTVDISANSHRGLSLMYVALLEEKLFDFIAESSNRPLFEVLAVLQLRNPLVHFAHLNYK